ncbi:MAG: phosphotransferase [Methylococcales bacterium]|jgi:aminoglycoside/choline kinase family phosphotransferase|nr:phosphotransferase [Methylococcales bacterium]
MMIDDLRSLAMLDWLENDLLLTINRCEIASSDASFRRYFRIHTEEGSFIIMDAPPDKEKLEPFMHVAALMAHAQLHVPAIFQHNLTDGFLLLEDLGSRCVLDEINSQNAHALYQTACASLLALQTNTDLANSQLPAYDAALLERELGIFEEWFLGQYLDIEIPADLWQNVRDILITSALEQPVTCVHRDYHSRNLMVLEDNSIGVIDFQDAVLGPITYDVVSLLRDCYIAWDAEQVESWMTAYYQQLHTAQLINCDLTQFKRWFDLMGMQRHLKAIGIFSRLNFRDNKPDYLNDIPRTLHYVTTQAAAYPEFAEFSAFLNHSVLPAL